MAQKKGGAKPRKASQAARSQSQAARSCGLCGKSTNLTRTECCGEWICDDEAEYVMFSYARNSCHRNHSRYTLCAYHYNEQHEGDWQRCQECERGFETEMYVWYGTNEYNFVKLEDPPKFKPTRCAKCKRVIKLGEDGYSMRDGGYYCERCTGFDFPRLR
jgi:hypothetical protein